MADAIQPNIEPYNHRGQAVLGVSIACGVLETAAVALRFLARRKLGAQWRMDDWLILIALVPNYVMIITGGLGGSKKDADEAVTDYDYSAVAKGKTGMPKSALSEQELIVFLKVDKCNRPHGLLVLTRPDPLRFNDHLRHYCYPCSNIDLALVASNIRR